MNQNTIRIGLDPGFGSIKAATINDKKFDTFILPSVVGIGTTDTGALALAGFVNTRRAEQPHHISWNDREYLVGPGIAAYARPIERMDMARFIDGPELLALVYTTLAHLGLSGCQLALAIGLPVELLQDKTAATTLEREIQARLCGSHRFTLDGQEVGFEIVKLRANIAQPLGCWLDWGLDNHGKWQKGPDGRTAPCIILDQGFNTLDIFSIKDGRPSPRFTAGDTLGMRRAAELITAAIRRRHGLELSLHEADELLRYHLDPDSGAVLVHVHGQPTDITPLITQALDSLAADVGQFIESRIGRAHEFRIILTGGGALALARRLQRIYPHAELAPAPVLANARGLAKLAQTSFLD